MRSNTKEAREKRCRYTLRKGGCSLHKSRARSWSYDDQCGYMIVNDHINGVVAGSRFDLTLEEVEDYCDISE